MHGIISFTCLLHAPLFVIIVRMFYNFMAFVLSPVKSNGSHVILPGVLSCSRLFFRLI